MLRAQELEVLAQHPLRAIVLAEQVEALPHVLAREPLERDVAAGLADPRASLAVLDRGRGLALQVVVVHEVGVDPRQSLLVPDLLRQLLGLAREREDVVQPTQLEERGAEVEAEVDGLLGEFGARRQVTERRERGLKGPHGFHVGGARYRAVADLAIVDHRLCPGLAARGVIRELIHVAREPIGVEPLDRRHDARVQGAALLLEQARVCDVPGEGVAEPVFEVREQPGLVQESRGLEVVQGAAQWLGGQGADRLEERERHLGADHGRRLQQELLVVRKPVDAGGEHGLHGRRNLEASGLGRESVGPPLAHEDVRLDERPHDLLEEEGIAVAPLDEQLPE